MSSFKIEKGVPIPPQGSGRPPGTTKYPWGEMEVGDRIHIPNPDKRKIGTIQASVGTLARIWAKYTDHPTHKFATRVVDGELYIWRVA